MKKLLLSIVILITSSLCHAQFCIKDGGLYVCDSDKDYIVYDFDGISAKDLYSKVKTAVIDIYVSGKNVASENEGEILSVNGVSKDDIFIKSMGLTHRLTMNYNLTFKFKDGKIRIDLPNINYIQTQSSPSGPLYFKSGSMGGLTVSALYVYKKDGSVRYQDAIDSTEKFFNSLISKILDKVKNGTEEEW